jgi:hypothetical protein
VKELLGLLAFSTFLQSEPATAEAAAIAGPNTDDESETVPPRATDPAAPTEYGHGGQFGLRAALTAGYRMVLRYDDSSFCTEPDPTKTASDQQKFCGHPAPPALDLALSYALVDFAEPYLWVRLGLAAEEQTRTKRIAIVGAGIRLYTMSDSAFKIYVEPAMGFELEGGEPTGAWLSNSPTYDRDVVFHVAAGPQLDLSQNFGVFIDGGVTVGVLRAIHSSLELKAGLQLRLP